MVRVLEKIDAGSKPPRLAGAHGAFFRRYAAERATAVRLALQCAVHIRRDGKLSGASLGEVTICPLQPEQAGSIVATPWGKVGRYLGLCPELQTVVLLRVWLSASSGREGLRALLGTEAGKSVRLVGGFLWSPPGTITSGRADFEVDAAQTDALWQNGPFLKATGDDLLAPVHPLDVRDVYVRGRPLLAQFRCVLALPVGTHRLRVPRLLSGAPLEMDVNISRADSSTLGFLHSGAAPILALVLREPWDEKWSVWAAEPVGPLPALEHLLSWSAHLQSLEPSFGGPDFDPVEAAVRELKALGLGAPDRPEAHAPHLRIPADTPEARLAMAVARAIRVGGAAAR